MGGFSVAITQTEVTCDDDHRLQHMPSARPALFELFCACRGQSLAATRGATGCYLDNAARADVTLAGTASATIGDLGSYTEISAVAAHAVE